MRKFLESIFFPGTRICELCGARVKDVEVPNHCGRNNGGGGWVHGLHVVMSKRGRELIERHARLSK